MCCVGGGLPGGEGQGGEGGAANIGSLGGGEGGGDIEGADGNCENIGSLEEGVIADGGGRLNFLSSKLESL